MKANALVTVAAGAILALIACSEDEGPSASAPCSITDPATCPEGQSCVPGSATVSANECVPELCAALRWSCCPILPVAESAACDEAAASKDATRCAQELKARSDAGFCKNDPGGSTLCNLTYCTNNLFASEGGDNIQTTCCSGSICVVPDKTDNSATGTCETCATAGAACEIGGESRCCPDTYCGIGKTCQPLLEPGEPCDVTTRCRGFASCEDGKCADWRDVGSSSGGSSDAGSSSGGATTGCDPASCSGSQSSCSGGYCFFCTYFCEGGSCQQRCSE